MNRFTTMKMMQSTTTKPSNSNLTISPYKNSYKYNPPPETDRHLAYIMFITWEKRDMEGYKEFWEIFYLYLNIKILLTFTILVLFWDSPFTHIVLTLGFKKVSIILLSVRNIGLAWEHDCFSNTKLKLINMYFKFIFKFINFSCSIQYQPILIYKLPTTISSAHELLLI